MGYLDNTEITIDAILTKKGRQKLASGEALGITKFALGDDEIDYSLYEPAHPRGSAYYDSAILAIPVLEANPDETQVLRYKLVTLEKTTKIPKIFANITEIRGGQGQGPFPIDPSTSPSGNGNAGYTLILANKNAGTLSIAPNGGATAAATVPSFLGDGASATAQVISGLKFLFTPNRQLTSALSTTITVFGNETGGTQTIPVTVFYQP